METRVMKNKSRIGKPWLLVAGEYVSVCRLRDSSPERRWKTLTQLGEFETKEAAIAAQH